MAKKAMSKPVLMGSAIALSLIIIVSATYAWFTAQETKQNKFKTGGLDGQVSIFERFTPPDHWVPNEEVVKNVGVLNTGNTPVLVRIHFTEYLDKLSKEGVEPIGHSKVDENTFKDHAPVECSLNYFYNSLTPTKALKTGWVELTQGMVNNSVTIPEKVTILYNSTTTGTGTSQVTHYQYFAYYTYTDTSTTPETVKYVRVQLRDNAISKSIDPATKKPITGKFDLKLKDANDPDPTNPNEYFKVLFYSEYNPQRIADWTKIKGQAPNMPTEAAYAIPGKANIYQSQADYKTADPYTYFDPDITKARIQLKYSGDLFPTAGPALTFTTKTYNEKWYYNDKDGYFYYMAVLQPDSQSKLLLESVKLHKDAGNEYALMSFQLDVGMEAIATSKTQLAEKWPTAIADPQLKLVLESYCDID